MAETTRVIYPPLHCRHGSWCGPGAFGPCELAHGCEMFERDDTLNDDVDREAANDE